MKKNTTISFSIPNTLAENIDKIVEDMHITRSAFLTALISTTLKWANEATPEEKKQLLNSVYGKRG